jgi:hypothetical protein
LTIEKALGIFYGGVKDSWRHPVDFGERYDKTVMEGELGDFPGPLRLHKVDETPQEPLWGHLVREFHYLGYQSMIGCRAKYLATLGDRLGGIWKSPTKCFCTIYDSLMAIISHAPRF